MIPSGEIVPTDGAVYRVDIAWWPDDVRARFVGGLFVPEGYENDPSRHIPPSLVCILEALVE